MFEPVRIDRAEDIPEAVRPRLLSQGGAGIAESVDRAVGEIISAVRERGDAALIELTERFDGVRLQPGDFHLSRQAIARAAEPTALDLRHAIEGMIENVRRFHSPQRREGYDVRGPHGTQLSLQYRPVSSAAVYVPGGSAAYPSTVVMNVVPATIAGVPRIVALTPPSSVRKSPVLFYALERLGVSEVIAVGGAQAIAAAAYGTESIRPVDVIVGPGNAYVAAAKRRVFGQVGIDSVAGPSEVVVLADGSAPIEWVVWDLLAQAEHDADARCILVTSSMELARAVQSRIEAAVEEAERTEIVRAALTDRGANCVVPDLDTAVALVNRVAPEHLQVMVADVAAPAPDRFIAGAIFYGPHSPTAVGDYWAGPNHVLPTGGTARYRGPLGVADFMVASSVVRYSQSAAEQMLEPARRLALAEGLPAHARSLGLRKRTDE